MTRPEGDLQKRNDFRSEITYPIWYRGIADGMREEEWARTTTRDLSGGGASFGLVDERRLLWKTGDLLEIRVILPPKPVFAIGRIVRLFQDDRGYLCAGVMFVSISPAEKDRVVRAVLNEGLERP